MRLAFLGTPDFAVPALNVLIDSGHDIVAVYSQPARPAGRGKKPTPSPVAARAENAGLAVRTPDSLKTTVEKEAFAALDLDLAVVVAYGQILPKAVLSAPRRGCVNLHASLLPRWRGAAPIQRAIMAGDRETGVDLIQMEAGLDTGPVLAEVRTPIGPRDTAADLHDRLAGLGADLLKNALPDLLAGRLEPRGQTADGVTYAHKIDKSEARLDWSLPADRLDAQIRGLSPFPGAWTRIGGERVKILLARPESAHGRAAAPGTVLDDDLLIACGDGALRIERAQRAGKAVMERQVLLRGFSVPAGSRAGGPEPG